MRGEIGDFGILHVGVNGGGSDDWWINSSEKDKPFPVSTYNSFGL